MNDIVQLERLVADVAAEAAGPSCPVDVAAITRAATNRSPKWRFQTMFSAVKFLVAGAIVALFGGFLLSGILGIQPEETGPAALTPSAEPYVVPSELPADLESGVFDTPLGPARWVRVTDAPANPSLMGAVATDEGFAVLDHWSNRLWHTSDLLSWTELSMPAGAESAGLLGRAGGSYWLQGVANGEVALWRSSELDEWETMDTRSGLAGPFRPAWIGQPVEAGEGVLVPVQFYDLPDLIGYLGLPAEPDGERYLIGDDGGWVFEPVEPGVYLVLTTSSDEDTMPRIRLEETEEGLRVVDAHDDVTLRQLAGLDRESMETLLALFAEKVDNRYRVGSRDALVREWAAEHGIALSELGIVDGDRLLLLEGIGRPDARLELFEAVDDLVLLEFGDDGRVGVRRSRDGVEWSSSAFAMEPDGSIIEASDWFVGTDVIELDVADGRVLRSSDGTTWEESRQPSVNRVDPLETGGFAEVLSGRRMGGMIAKLAVDDGAAETLSLYLTDGERIDIDLRPLGIGTSYDDGEDMGFGSVISDRTVALSFGSPPRRGVGEYVILSFDELAE